LAWAKILKEGATPIEETLRSEGRLGGFHSNLDPSYSLAPDLHFEGILVLFGDHLLRGRNIEHFQPSRVIPVLDPTIQGHTSRDLKDSSHEGKEINLVTSYIQWVKVESLYIFSIVPDLQIHV
jgi:hypothetical protein